MTEEILSATSTISAPAGAVFAVLADPSQHAAIDGAGWVCESVDSQRLTGPGQIFRMSMYHPNHPDGNYQMANPVLAFEPPHVISWQPGSLSQSTGELEFAAGSGVTAWPSPVRARPRSPSPTTGRRWGRVPAGASSSRRSPRTTSITR
jgi:uncharacterized protein YndB with AHSA1/START domain